MGFYGKGKFYQALENSASHITWAIHRQGLYTIIPKSTKGGKFTYTVRPSFANRINQVEQRPV